MKLTVGEKIALLRKERNITQTQLAEYLFLAPQAVSRWEAGGGAPEITLLPRIAAFFGVSIDELFGLTSMERTEELVMKYSVLRDDSSFREAMDYIDSQLQTIAALPKSGGEDAAEIERERDRMEAEKLHMWLQQGREGFRRALAIADRFVQKTEGDPGDPWYLPMRLQRDQLLCAAGRGRETLEERRRDFTERPDTISLLRYFSVLDIRQEYEAILAETEGLARDLLFPPSRENLSVWLEVVNAAAKTGSKELIGKYLPPVRELCGSQEEIDLLMCLLDVYEGGELEGIKERVRVLLPQAGINHYFEDKIREKLGDIRLRDIGKA